MLDLRHNWAIVVGKAIVWTLLVVTVFNVSSFEQSTDVAINRSFSQKADVDMYGLVDRLDEPEAFHEFRQSRQNLEALGAFYNGLNEHAELSLLSVFDQPVPVRDFAGDTTFDPGYGTEVSVRGTYADEGGHSVQDVKSLQLNQNAFDFYRLEVDEGDGFDWDAVDYTSGTLPVLLGSSYSGVYDVGDVMRGSYYFRPVEFEVMGILDDRASIYYQGELNHYLDHYLLLPYPQKVGEFTAAEQDFAGILYFAMVNADLAAPKGSDTDEVLREIAMVAETSGFDQYSLLNLPNYMVQFSLVKSVIQGNAALVKSIGAMLFLGVVVASGFGNWQLMRRRRRKTLVFSRLGRSRNAIDRMFTRSSLVGYGMTFLATAVAVRQLPAGSSSALVTALFVLALLTVLDVAHQHYLLRRCLDVDSGKAASL
ncbi:hypothetical protein BJH93_14560 [Kocuria polaris]|nr:hypothetical protein [Kocuria polaris]